MGNFKVLGRNKVLEAHAFDVEQVHYELPDGRRRTYDLVDHANAVTLVAVNSDWEVFFVRQYRVGAEDILLELPAGILDNDEKPELAARRELREEIGMNADTLKEIGGFYMTAGYSNEFMTVFLATDLKYAPLDADEDEFLEVERIPCSTTYEMAHRGLIRDGKSLTALFLAHPYLMNGEGAFQ